MMRPITILLLWLCWSNLYAQSDPPAPDSTSVHADFILTDPREIIQHEGTLITIEGCIVRATYNDRLKGKPIFLDMFAPYPDNPFSVVIWEPNQSKFLPALEYHQKKVRITGRPMRKKNQERLSIELHHPKQITILGLCKS